MKTLVTFCFVLFIYLLPGCMDDKKVKIIEERDPIVKIIEERDSIVIYTKDSTGNKVIKQK